MEGQIKSPFRALAADVLQLDCEASYSNLLLLRLKTESHTDYIITLRGSHLNQKSDYLNRLNSIWDQKRQALTACLFWSQSLVVVSY